MIPGLTISQTVEDTSFRTEIAKRRQPRRRGDRRVGKRRTLHARSGIRIYPYSAPACRRAISLHELEQHSPGTRPRFAVSAGFPHHCYLLHLPLEARGLIDEEMVRASPKRATVRRFWPSQPDLRGYVIKMSKGWASAKRRGRDIAG